MPDAVLALLMALAQFSQAQTGELRITVVDAGGLPLIARVELTSDATDFRDLRDTGADGTLIARRLPFGPYRLQIRRPASHAAGTRHGGGLPPGLAGRWAFIRQWAAV
jgi:hypothetical protein